MLDEYVEDLKEKKLYYMSEIKDITGMNATLNTIDRAFHLGYVSAVPLCNRCNTCTCMLSA